MHFFQKKKISICLEVKQSPLKQCEKSFRMSKNLGVIKNFRTLVMITWVNIFIHLYWENLHIIYIAVYILYIW